MRETGAHKQRRKGPSTLQLALVRISRAHLSLCDLSVARSGASSSNLGTSSCCARPTTIGTRRSVIITCAVRRRAAPRGVRPVARSPTFARGVAWVGNGSSVRARGGGGGGGRSVGRSVGAARARYLYTLLQASRSRYSRAMRSSMRFLTVFGGAGIIVTRGRSAEETRQRTRGRGGKEVRRKQAGAAVGGGGGVGAGGGGGFLPARDRA